MVLFLIKWLLVCGLFGVVFSENSIFPSLPLGVPFVGNKVCQKHSDLFVSNYKNLSLWAQEMWDATAKSSTGVLRGSVFQMGHFEQCLNARAPFRVQYCLATLKANIPKPDNPRDPLSLYHHPYDSVLQRLYKYDDVSQQSRNVIQVGWCIPASCTPGDLEESLNIYLENDAETPLREYNVSYVSKVAPITCQTKEDNQNFDAADITFCLVILVLVVLLILSTSYDLNLNPGPLVVPGKDKPLKRTVWQKLGVAFSIKKNFKDLNRADESNPALTLLYGVRTLAILMIIMDHRFGTFTSSALLNFDYVETQYRSPLACLLFHGDLFVDSFFILSGLLVTYGLLSQMDKKPINPCFFIILRYIRLTPVYAFVIFYYATLFNHTGSGPLWTVIAGQDSQDCRDNWWTNLLYISNYVHPDHMCMTHSWYLPCDFHYFIIAIAICALIKKEKKLGFGALTFFTILSIVVPFVLTIVYLRPALLYFYPEFLTGPKTHPDFLLTYSKSHTRATPYFCGMFAGYLYYKLKGTEHHLCRYKSYTVLLVSLIMILVAIFGGAVFYNPYHPYNALESATYAALHRPAWAIGSIGLLYVGSYGHASVIYNTLSWAPFIPLSKLVYGAYLIHMQFQLRAAAKFMNPRQISYFDAISLSLSDMVLSFATALVLYIGIEAPFKNVFKELLMPSRDSQPKGSPREQNLQENMIGNNNGHRDSRL